VPVDLDAESARVVDAYRSHLIEVSAACIKSSLGSLSKARVGFAAERVAGVCFNRRGEGVVDDSLHVVRIDRDSGGSVSILNYSCHPVVLGPSNRYISADYPGAARNIFEANTKLFYSADTAAVFLNGACGDVNPATCRGYECSGSFRDLYAIGGPIAFEALKLYSSVKTEEIWDLRFRSISVRLPIRPPPPLDEAEKRFRELRAKYGGDYRNPELLYARELYLLSSLGLKDYIDAEIGILKVNNGIIIFVPGEPFAALGLAIKKLSPHPNTMLVGYLNKYIGYIPTPRDFEKGGYETLHSRWSMVKPEAYSILIETIAKNLNNM